jgi:hydrogenase/urease accessory protein HupE
MAAMRFAAVALALMALMAIAPPAAEAHPAPFSYLDVQLRQAGFDLTLTVHVIDMAHELGIPPARLMDKDVARANAPAMAALIGQRLKLLDNETATRGNWVLSDVIVDKDAIQFKSHVDLDSAPGAVGIETLLFPYDPIHQTFVNVYEAGAVEPSYQEILSAGRTAMEYIAGTRQGALTTVRRFIPAGFHHILIGPDHILFLVGLLLLGGPMRKLFMIVTAFTLAHSVTLSLAALNLVPLYPWIIEPAIALSIVYVGVDNLVGADGRDVRPWIALGFGLIHGFGFANVLGEMQLPARTLGWALFSFNLGVEIGQLVIVVIVASAFAAVRARSEAMGKKLVFVGSLLVAAAGAFWFVERVFFPA